MASTMKRSIALTPDEVDTIQWLAQQESLTERTVIQRIFASGLRTHLLETALHAYSKGRVSIGEAAQMAQMPYLDFFEELRRRRLVVIDETVNLKAELSDLAQKMNHKRLSALVDKL
jgi:predicted HTH domain antitoxin